jgi:hypothetical protein
MAIDIRGAVECSLGPVISGGIGDDYIQGNGLVKTNGDVEINGLITPAIGTVVTFSYTKNGVQYDIPRKLRVLSSFADPFRRTTKVELGCKLTYLSDLKEAINWDVFSDPENSDYSAADSLVVTLPIHASSVMDECLSRLGITASSNPLTNKFSTAEFNFKNEYVQILGDLLISESYFGYLDANEVLQIVDLTQEGGIGPVYTSNDIIDLGAINAGQLPGESVTVSYSSLKLKQPDNGDPNSKENRARRWEYSSSFASPVYYTIGSRLVRGSEKTETTTYYTRINDSDVPYLRITEETANSAKIGGTVYSAYQNFGIFYYLDPRNILQRETEITTYDKDGNKTASEVTVYERVIAVVGGLSVELVYPDQIAYVVIQNSRVGSSQTSFSNSIGDLIPTSRTVRQYLRFNDVEQEVITEYKLWSNTIPGQQSIAESREYINTISEAVNYINNILDQGLTIEKITTNINIIVYVQGRPVGVINSSYSKDGDPNNGWRTDSVASLELALGSSSAQRRLELSMPYAPDDIFSGPSGGPFTSIASDAPMKATRYGRAQNRLFLGNRSGINIQVAPEKLPAAPFSPVYIQANGLTALYRLNSNQWAFSADGIVCSTDALFWGAVGGTGEFWFPVAPGVTTLPETPPVVDGQMNAEIIVHPYNETFISRSIVKTEVIVKSFAYSFNLLTVVPVITTKIGITAERAVSGLSGSLEVVGSDVSFIRSSRAIAASKGDFLVASQNVNFAPAVLFANKGSYLVNSEYTDLVKPWIITTGTVAPVLGSTGFTGETLPSGWEWVAQGVDLNDDYILVDELPYGLAIGLSTYSSCYFDSNTYITFGGYAGIGTFLAEDWPPLAKIFFGSGDHSMQALLRKNGTDPTGEPYVKLRYEGTANTSGTPGSPTIVLEVTFYRPLVSYNNRETWIEVRVGVHAAQSGLFMIATEDTALASSSIAPNTSWVLRCQHGGSSWTMTSNRYIP